MKSFCSSLSFSLRQSVFFLYFVCLFISILNVGWRVVFDTFDIQLPRHKNFMTFFVLTIGSRDIGHFKKKQLLFPLYLWRSLFCLSLLHNGFLDLIVYLTISRSSSSLYYGLSLVIDIFLFDSRYLSFLLLFSVITDLLFGNSKFKHIQDDISRTVYRSVLFIIFSSYVPGSLYNS